MSLNPALMNIAGMSSCSNCSWNPSFSSSQSASGSIANCAIETSGPSGSFISYATFSTFAFGNAALSVSSTSLPYAINSASSAGIPMISAIAAALNEETEIVFVPFLVQIDILIGEKRPIFAYFFPSLTTTSFLNVVKRL